MNLEAKSVTALILILGAVIQLFGYATGIIQAFANPGTAILLSAVGLLVMTPIALHYLFSQLVQKSTLLGNDGAEVTRSTWAYCGRIRLVTGGVWATFAPATLTVIAVNATFHLRPLKVTQGVEYPIRYFYNTLVEQITNVEWGGQFAAKVSLTDADTGRDVTVQPIMARA